MDDGASSYRRFHNGDREAFVEIVDLYRENLIFFLYRFVGDMEVAEDLAEDVFVELLLHPGRFRFQCSLKTWLFSIGRNKAISYIRKQSKVICVEPGETGRLMEGRGWDASFNPNCVSGQQTQETLEEAVLRGEEKQALSRAMERISGDYSTAIHLVYFEELTYEEAGRVMKKSRKQIENLIYRGKQALRKILEEEGIGIEEQR